MIAARTMPDAPDAADETDGGRPAASRRRTCAASRVERPVGDLIRFVVGPDGAVVPDLKACLPGRGVWVTADRRHVDMALKRGAFPRSFKRRVTVPPELPALVDGLMAERARASLSIANKAGEVVSGTAKVEEALARGAAALIHAEDAAADGSAKLDRRHRGPVYRVVPGMELDLALGRGNVVHAALVGGPASAACMGRLDALVRYRTGIDDGTTAAAPTTTDETAETDRE